MYLKIAKASQKMFCVCATNVDCVPTKIRPVLKQINRLKLTKKQQEK